MTQEPITIPEAEMAQVDELRRMLRLGPPELVGQDGRERISLSPSIYRLLKDAVSHLQRGRSISIVREDEELTTQRAANILGVSRPHFVKLLESGEMPFHKTGSHRRVLFSDVMAFARKRDAERKAILNDLARAAYAEGLYDDASIPDGGEDE
jgi:excisionase family DNA binding protein